MGRQATVAVRVGRSKRLNRIEAFFLLLTYNGHTRGVTGDPAPLTGNGDWGPEAPGS